MHTSVKTQKKNAKDFGHRVSNPVAYVSQPIPRQLACLLRGHQSTDSANCAIHTVGMGLRQSGALLWDITRQASQPDMEQRPLHPLP